MSHRKALLTVIAAIPLTAALSGSLAADSAGMTSTVSADRSTPVRLNSTEKKLVGRWASDDTARGAAAGTITLTIDRAATLAPNSSEHFEISALKGTWSSKASQLTIDVPGKGTASMTYALSRDGKTLTFEYANGIVQTFERSSLISEAKPTVEGLLP